jgi:Arc/MetJ-type ribon-helix-helix transcriptional regulator
MAQSTTTRVTVRLLREQDEELEALVEKAYPSTSQALRVAVQRLLEQHPDAEAPTVDFETELQGEDDD